MKAFYDKIVPNVANDLLKKLGGGRVANLPIASTSLQELARKVYAEDFDKLPATAQASLRASVIQNVLTQPGFDITPALRERALGGLPLFSRRKKGIAAPEAPLFSRRAPREVFNSLQQGAQDWLDATINSDRSIGRLMRSINTQYHKAKMLTQQGKPEFERVYNLGQQFQSDTVLLAAQAAQYAPNILHQPKSPRDFFRGASEEDLRAIDKPLNEGTLYGGGNPLSGIRWSEQQLKDRYQLTPTQIKLYNEYLDATAESVDIMAKAQIAAHAKTNGVAFDRDLSLRDMTAEVVQQLEDEMAEAESALEHATDTEAILDEMDATGEPEMLMAMYERLAKELPQQIDRLEKTINNVKAIADRAQRLREAGYKPLMRFGEHTVTARDEEGNVVFYGMYEGGFFKKRGELEAKRVAQALREENPDWTVTTAPLSKEKYKLYAGINLEALQLFADHMDAEAKEPYQEYLRQAVNNRSALKRMIHRKGTPGFSTDARRTLAQFVLSNGRLAASQYNLSDMLKAANAIPEGDIQDEAVA
jgi:hypothetical protein